MAPALCQTHLYLRAFALVFPLFLEYLLQIFAGWFHPVICILAQMFWVNSFEKPSFCDHDTRLLSLSHLLPLLCCIFLTAFIICLLNFFLTLRMSALRQYGPQHRSGLSLPCWTSRALNRPGTHWMFNKPLLNE